MSFTILNYHLIFSTKSREKTILIDHERLLYDKLYRVAKAHGAFVYRIGGMPDHVHLLISLPSNVALSSFVQDLKQKSSIFMKELPQFPQWRGWSEGYGGFSVSYSSIGAVKKYIIGQKQHHTQISFRDEYRKFLIENGISEDAPFFPK
ncbi:MAG: IS200/IS605 family transposase [Bacteroides sp.]|nr:IS200/IS605 family transposase [Bacteroides sp.]MCM1389652.1 IS200/IS605 family transposase [Bacteroides sp.]